MMRAILILAIVSLAQPARADRAKAEQHFNAGAQAFGQQRFAAAADQFELAYKEAPLPAIAFSAAQAYRRLYFIEPKPHYVQRAVQLYRIYLDNVKSGGRSGDASEGLAEMQRELDKLTAQGAKIEVVQKVSTRIAVSVIIAGEKKAAVTELSAMPASEGVGAVVKLDGKLVELFVPVDVSPGDHTIEVSAPGYFSQTLKRRAVEGVTDLVEVELQPQPAKLAIRTEDGAVIALDGRPVGTAPLAPQELAAGTYTITVTRRGREPVVREVVLARAEAKTVEIALVKTGRRKAVPWLLGAAGGLAVASGITTALALNFDGKMTEIDDKRLSTGISEAELADYRRAANRRDLTRNAAWVTGGLAVAVGATATFLYFFDTPAPGERNIVPTANATGAGVAVVGTF